MGEQLIISVKYFTNITPLRKVDIGDWVDLRAAKSIQLAKGEHRLIPLGVAMKLPKGYEAHIVPRSSSFKKFGIIQTNSPGIVDESYCGDEDQWFMSVVAMRDTEIKKDDRICQFRIVKKMPEFVFYSVQYLGNADRGGHGSTGTN